MAYHEKDFQTEFNRWLKIIYRRTGVFELKISKTSSIPFSDVKPHQESALYAAKHGTLAYKIPDDTYSQKPFDCFAVTEVPAFVVVMFNAKSSHFYMIEIESWMQAKRDSSRKSLTEAEASNIGSKYDLSGSTPYQQRGSKKPVNVG